MPFSYLPGEEKRFALVVHTIWADRHKHLPRPLQPDAFRLIYKASISNKQHDLIQMISKQLLKLI